VYLGEKGDVLVDREVAVQAEALRQIADLVGDRPMFAHRVLAEHAHLAAIGVEQPAHHTDGGRLSRAVGTDETEHLAARDVERQAGKRLCGAVTLDDLLEQDGGRHGSDSSASTGIPALRMPSRLSTLTLMR
jgi:hypothetical protein